MAIKRLNPFPENHDMDLNALFDANILVARTILTFM